MAKTITKCASCGYPLSVESIGQEVQCPMCSSINEVIGNGVTVPTPLFVGTIAFGLGVLLGPALIATTDSGRNWLEKQARAKIGG